MQGGGGVVRRAHEPKAGKIRGDSCLVAPVLEPGEPETDRDRPPMNVAEPGLSQNLVDERAQAGDRGGEIDMNIRRSAAGLGQHFSISIAQPRAAARGAAIDPEIERRVGHAASPSSVRSISAAAAARSASAAAVGVSRLSLAPCGVCSGVTGKCTKTAGIADFLSRRYCKAAK